MSELDLSLEENDIKDVFTDKKEESVLPVEKPKKRIRKNVKNEKCETRDKFDLLINLVTSLQLKIDILSDKLNSNEVAPGEYFGHVPNVVNEPIEQNTVLQTVNNNEIILPTIIID